jgi:hypothetical protein
MSTCYQDDHGEAQEAGAKISTFLSQRVRATFMFVETVSHLLQPTRKEKWFCEYEWVCIS